MEGAFQKISQHFLDFLSHVNVVQETTANKSIHPSTKESVD